MFQESGAEEKEDVAVGEDMEEEVAAIESEEGGG